MRALKKIYWLAKAVLANLIYGHPAKSLKIIGVTGTNGKTTTCFFIDSILQNAGFKTARITTIDYHLNDTPKPNPVHLTTFDAFRLQSFLSQARRKKIDWVILEISSHGLAQNRVFGVELERAVVTYASREHLDFHQSIEDYLQSKAKILTMLKKQGIAVLNRDDKNYNFYRSCLFNNKITFGLLRGDIRAERIEYKQKNTNFLLCTPQGNIRVNLALCGRFNVYNALAATGAVLQRVSLDQVKQGLEALKYVPGRMEEIKVRGQNFRLIVDYVHTPDSLPVLLEELRPKAKRLIIVFGMPGQRDPSNRPLMGQAADRGADIIILTNENPRKEDTMSIINQIASGIKNKIEGEDLFKIVDRKQAIKKAIKLAQEGDLVLVAGKGPENYIELKNKTIAWDDRLISRQLLKEFFKIKK